MHAQTMAPSTVTVEIDTRSDPITGRVINAGRSNPFCGWLELAAAIQTAIDGADADDVRAG